MTLLAPRSRRGDHAGFSARRPNAYWRFFIHFWQAGASFRSLMSGASGLQGLPDLTDHMRRDLGLPPEQDRHNHWDYR
jgi:hypothetical protein